MGIRTNRRILTGSKAGFGLANSMHARTSVLKNSVELNKATSSAAVLPRFTPQQALNSGIVAGISFFTGKAVKETFDTIQEFRRFDEDLRIPGFRPEIIEPTPNIFVTPPSSKSACV